MLWKSDMKPLQTSVVWQRRMAWQTNCGTPSLALWREWVDRVDSGWPLRLTFQATTFLQRYRRYRFSLAPNRAPFQHVVTSFERKKTERKTSWRLWVLPCLNMSYLSVFSPCCSASSTPEMKAELRPAKNMLVQQTRQRSTVKLWNLQTWDYSCQFNLFHCKNWSILRVNKMNNLSSTVRTSIDAWPHRIFSAMAFCRGWLRKAKHRSSTASSAALISKQTSKTEKLPNHITQNDYLQIKTWKTWTDWLHRLRHGWKIKNPQGPSLDVLPWRQEGGWPVRTAKGSWVEATAKGQTWAKCCSKVLNLLRV